MKIAMKIATTRVRMATKSAEPTSILAVILLLMVQVTENALQPPTLPPPSPAGAAPILKESLRSSPNNENLNRSPSSTTTIAAPQPEEDAELTLYKHNNIYNYKGYQLKVKESGGDEVLPFGDRLPIPPPNHAQQEESRLLQFLMQDYDREVRPVVSVNDTVTVHVGITLTQIFDMDEKNQVMTTNVWLDQEWHDQLLTWNPEDFGGITRVRIPCDKIWLPDIVLYNNADDYTSEYMRSLALIFNTGKVFWPPPTKFRSTCPVNVAFFPFDDQECKLRLGSWLHDGQSVNVTNRTSHVDLSYYVPNGEWQLLGTPELIRIERWYPEFNASFIEITVLLNIRRKTLYYMYNIVFPCMMMSTLTVLVFCLPPDSGEKIALGVTVLLAFSVFMLAIAEKMPETSESIPLIGIYLTSVMAITCVSVIMTVCVLNFFYRGPTLTHVPIWAQKYILGKKKMTRGRITHNRNESVMHKRRTSHAGMPQDDSWSGFAERYTIDMLQRHLRSRQENNSGSSIAGTTTAHAHNRSPRGSTHSRLRSSNGSVQIMGNGGIGGLPAGSSSPLASFPDIDADDVDDDIFSNSRRSSRGIDSLGGVTGAEVLAAGLAEEAAATAAANGGRNCRSNHAVDIKLIPPSGSESGSTSPQIDTFTPNHVSSNHNHSNHVSYNNHNNHQFTNHIGGTGQHLAEAFASLNLPGVSSGVSAHFRRNSRTTNTNLTVNHSADPGDLDLQRIITMMAEKQKEDDQLNEILKDWKMLAQKVDYFLFWVFLCITSVTSLLFIFLLPYYNRGKLL